MLEIKEVLPRWVSGTAKEPVVVAPTPNATRFLFNADRSAYLHNAGSDLELVTLAGTVGTPVQLNAPEQAAGRYSTFVRQD